MSQTTKCIAVHLPVDLIDNIDICKSQSGKSQSGLIIDLIRKGLGVNQSKSTESSVFFYVKVRIDPAKMIEFGKKLHNGEIDSSKIIVTYCIKDDPTVGISFWQAEDKDSFEKVFSQHKPFYKEILEVIPMITPTNSMHLILENLRATSRAIV